MSMTAPKDHRKAVETLVVEGHRVACDGGGGALGHPKVWYEMGDEGEVECLYCGRVYMDSHKKSDLH